jgi:hypothetical protein
LTGNLSLMVPCRHNCFHAPEDVGVGMDMSLRNLGLSYGMCYDLSANYLRSNRYIVDLFLMHCQSYVRYQTT